MAIAKPKVEWISSQSAMWREYGLLCIAGKWAVVRAKDTSFNVRDDYEVVTEWVDDRKTAIGFWKLLKET